MPELLLLAPLAVALAAWVFQVHTELVEDALSALAVGSIVACLIAIIKTHPIDWTKP
jgi:hypothetical protein